MVITKKIEPKTTKQIDDYVSEGGTVAVDRSSPYEWKTFCLRVPVDFMKEIDKLRKRRIGQSYNNWILETISDRLEREAKNE